MHGDGFTTPPPPTHAQHFPYCALLIIPTPFFTHSIPPSSPTYPHNIYPTHHTAQHTTQHNTQHTTQHTPNTQVTFASLYEFLEAASRQVLHCPRCSHTVTAAHGVCAYCHENAYQCRECRYINYAQLDGWLCTECGHSRYGRFDVSVLCGAPTGGIPAVKGAREYARVLKALGMVACGGGALWGVLGVGGGMRGCCCVWYCIPVFCECNSLLWVKYTALLSWYLIPFLPPVMHHNHLTITIPPLTIINPPVHPPHTPRHANKTGTQPTCCPLCSP